MNHLSYWTPFEFFKNLMFILLIFSMYFLLNDRSFHSKPILAQHCSRTAIVVLSWASLPMAGQNVLLWKLIRCANSNHSYYKCHEVRTGNNWPLGVLRDQFTRKHWCCNSILDFEGKYCFHEKYRFISHIVLIQLVRFRNLRKYINWIWIMSGV